MSYPDSAVWRASRSSRRRRELSERITSTARPWVWARRNERSEPRPGSNFSGSFHRRRKTSCTTSSARAVSPTTRRASPKTAPPWRRYASANASSRHRPMATTKALSLDSESGTLIVAGSSVLGSPADALLPLPGYPASWLHDDRSSVLGDGPYLDLELLVFRRVGERHQRHQLGHVGVVADLDPALHEGGVGIQLPFLDLAGVVVGHSHRDLGVLYVTELVLQQMPVLEEPVVAHVALRTAGDDVLHPGRGARTLRLGLRHLLGFVKPLLREPFRHWWIPPVSESVGPLSAGHSTCRRQRQQWSPGRRCRWWRSNRRAPRRLRPGPTRCPRTDRPPQTRWAPGSGPGRIRRRDRRSGPLRAAS